VAYSTIVKTKRDGTIKFLDNGGSNTYTVEYEAGDLSLTIPGSTVVNPLDRGQFGATPSLRYGDDQPITGSFTAYLRDLTDGSAATLEDIISQSGFVGSTWVSTLGTNAEVFTVTIEWKIEGTDHGDAADHTLTLNHCVVTGGFSEGDPDTISISFTSYDLFPTAT
jgi:hypothetical protein